jgi:hypothetical protein
MSEKTIRRMMVGFILGAAFGVPASYFFQAAILRMGGGLGEYLMRFNDVWGNATLGMGQTARITVVLCAVAGAITVPARWRSKRVSSRVRC